MISLTPTTLRAWLNVIIVALACFVFFATGSMVLARLTGQAPLSLAVSMIALPVCGLIAFAMSVGERRRDRPSVDAAAWDGVKIAAVVIVAGNITGSSDAGVQLAVRTALILVGIPLLEVLTHVLARGTGDAFEDRSP